MPGITLTGADERTDLEQLKLLAHDGAEIGILFTLTPEGRNRYPGIPWIVRTIEALKPHGKVAVHFCGSKAKAGLLRGNFAWIVEHVDRIQVNGNLTVEEAKVLCNGYPETTIITQYPATENLRHNQEANHAWLMDASQGKGKLPNSWQRPDTQKPVGFAGGLGPSNLHVELPKIAKVAWGEWWVDMEGKLRDEEDWFDVKRAIQVMAFWNDWKGGNCA